MTETRKIGVLTTSLVRFTIEGTRWQTTMRMAGDEERMAIQVLRTEPASPPLVVAEFPDVQAIWYEDSGSLVPPEEPDEEDE